MSKHMIKNKQKGSALFFSLIILSLLLAIVFGISTIVFLQLQSVARIGESVIALSAADSGIEKTLYDRKFYSYPDELPPPSSFTLPNGASYQTTIYSPGDSECPLDTASWFCVKSIGVFKNTKRGLKVSL